MVKIDFEMAHSFNATAYAAIRIEDPNHVAELRADAIAAYRPQNSQELFACERIAIAQAKLFRCGILDAGFHNSFLNECLRPDGMPHNLVLSEVARDVEVRAMQNRALCLTTGLDRLTRESDAFKIYMRYADHCRREYREAREEMRDLMKLRDTLTEPQLEIPDPIPSELMPPPPPESECQDLSVYDPNVRVMTPLWPHQRFRFKRTQSRARKSANPDDVPESVRKYRASQGRPPNG